MNNLEKRKGIPSRKGYYTSKLTNIKYHYDSMCELAMMMHLDSIGIVWEKNTKIRIPYIFEGKQRKYIPDFFISGDRFFNPLLIEIKGSNDRPELPFKIEAAKKYCKEHNLSFSLRSYVQIRNLIEWDKVKEYHKNFEKKC